MEVARMSQPQVPSQVPKKAKKIYLYRNGLAQDGKVMVINDRVVRDFPTLLTYATSGLKAPVAIRNLYTPQNGHRVGNLDDLQPGQVYVAAGQEKFKKIKYGTPRLLPKRRGDPYSISVPTRKDQAVVASARYKKPTLKPFYIHVFRNGDENFRGVRVLLTQRTLYSMDHVLELVMEKAELFTSASRLCNMDGTPVKTLSQLENGKQYVAIEGNKPFKKVRYSTHDTIMESKRVGDGSQGTVKPKLLLTAGGTGGYHIPHPPPSKPIRMRKFRREERPMGGRKDKEKREKALEDQRADSVFGAPKRKPKQPLLVTSQLLDQAVQESDNKNPPDESSLLHSTTNSIDTHASTLPETSGHHKIFHASEETAQSPIKSYKEETASGIFKSKLESSETQAAEDVHEAQDIEVEHPIDHEQAQEVEELPKNDQIDITPAVDDNKASAVSTPASTKQQSPLQSNSGQLSPPKKTVSSRSGSNSKLSSKSGDSLGASSGHNSPTKTHSNNATKVSSRAGGNDSKQSKRSNDTVASKKSRTSHHSDT